MYKVIGADGREYGPVSPDVVRQWIAEGRVSAQTLAQPAGSAEWKPLGSYPEFIQATPPGFAPAPPGPMRPPSTNSMAVAGLLFGLLGLTGGWICCGPLFSVLGIVFSSVGLAQIKRNPMRETGKGLAVTGLLLSILGLIVAVGLGVFLGTMRMWCQPGMQWHRQWQF